MDDADSLLEEPVEPGSPTLENVVFVLLGVLATVGVIYQVATLVG